MEHSFLAWNRDKSRRGWCCCLQDSGAGRLTWRSSSSTQGGTEPREQALHLLFPKRSSVSRCMGCEIVELNPNWCNIGYHLRSDTVQDTKFGFLFTRHLVCSENQLGLSTSTIVWMPLQPLDVFFLSGTLLVEWSQGSRRLRRTSMSHACCMSRVVGTSVFSRPNYLGAP